MTAYLKLLTSVLVSLLKSRGLLEAEVVLLRHQLNVLRRAAPPRLRFTSMDRLIFVWLYRLCPSLLNAVGIIKPATVLRWHTYLGLKEDVALAGASVLLCARDPI